MNSQKTLVFDVGGTSIRAGIFDIELRKLVARAETKTPNNYRFPSASQAEILVMVVDEMRRLGDSLLGSHQPSAVVAGVPGPVNTAGAALALPTIIGKPLINPFPFLKRLSTFWNTPNVHVINDLSAAGYRYVARGDNEFCLLSCGSGVGMKVFVGGNPLLGSTFLGGEVGHLAVDGPGSALTCDCGAQGHLGAIASGRGVRSLAVNMAHHNPESYAQSVLIRDDPDLLTTEDIVRAFRQGDAWAKTVVGEAATPLAHLIASIHLSTGVDKFILIGGFAISAGNQFISSIMDKAERSIGMLTKSWNQMLTLGYADDDHGLAGAGYYSLMRSST